MVIQRILSLASKKQKMETENPIVLNDGYELDDLDLKIVNDLLDDSTASSTVIANKYGRPLSTIQRRRSRLEKGVLLKNYSINVSKTNWRSGEIFVRVLKGRTEEVAGDIFNKYASNVTLVSTTMNNVGNLIIHIYYRNSPQMFSILEELRRMPGVDDVMYAEHIDIVGERKPKFILEDFMKNSRSDRGNGRKSENG